MACASMSCAEVGQFCESIGESDDVTGQHVVLFCSIV